MPGVAVVTDATASLGQELCRELNIHVVPVPIQLGDESFLDGSEPPEKFYSLLAQGRLPATATPGPGTFLEIYQVLAREATEIISIHVMSTKSAVLQTAGIAAGMLSEARVHMVDSGNTTLGLGLLVQGAARLARAGHSAAAILEWLHAAKDRTQVVAAIRDLGLLQRSGRVSMSKALLAGLLNIKPVLRLRTGAIDVVDQVRSWSRAVDRLLELAQETVAGEAARLRVAVVHTNSPDDGAALFERVRERWPGAESMLSDAGPSLASHAGIGALGICTLLAPPEPIQAVTPV